MSQEIDGPQRGWQSLVGDVVIGGDRALTEQGHWEACSTIELYNGVHAEADPQQVHNRADEWEHLGTLMGEHTDLFETAIHTHTQNWTGAAAEGARHTLTKLVAWSTQASRTASAMAPPLRKQGEILARARASMPEPAADPTVSTAEHAFNGDGVAGMASAATDMAPGAAKGQRAHQQAVDAMRTMEESSHQVDEAVPEFVPPQSTGVRHHHAAHSPAMTVTNAPDAHHGEPAPTHTAAAPGHVTSPAADAPRPTPAASTAPAGTTDFRPETSTVPPAQPQATAPAGVSPMSIQPEDGPGRSHPMPSRTGQGQVGDPVPPRPVGGPVSMGPAESDPKWGTGTESAGLTRAGRGDRNFGPAEPRMPIAPDDEVGGLRRHVGDTLNPHANAAGRSSPLRNQLSGGDSGSRSGRMTEGGRTGAGQERPSTMGAQAEPGKASGSSGSRMAPSGVGRGKGGKGGEDGEHKAAGYLREDNLFDVPEARKLPPPVIGERKKTKRKAAVSKKDSPSNAGSAKPPTADPKR